MDITSISETNLKALQTISILSLENSALIYDEMSFNKDVSKLSSLYAEDNNDSASKIVVFHLTTRVKEIISTPILSCNKDICGFSWLDNETLGVQIKETKLKKSAIET